MLAVDWVFLDSTERTSKPATRTFVKPVMGVAADLPVGRQLRRDASLHSALGAAP